MSLLLLFGDGGGGPTTQPGVRSLLAFWIGGAAMFVVGAETPYTRSRVVNAYGLGSAYLRANIVNSGG